MTSRRAGATTKTMRVMVATDGSPAGAAALRFGARLARLDSSVSLTVVTVASENGHGGSSQGVTSAEDGARVNRTMASAARTLSREGVKGGVTLVALKHAESVPDAISRQADQLRADLVVVGSEGRDTLKEWVVGGVALRLIYVASRPVVVVRAPRRRQR